MNTINLSEYSFYSFFTQHSLLDNVGLFSGLASRIAFKIIPELDKVNSIEYLINKKQINAKQIAQALTKNTVAEQVVLKQLNKAIEAILSKIISFGLDHRTQFYINLVSIQSNPFLELLSQINSFERTDYNKLIETLHSIKETIKSIREIKAKTGVNIHFTVLTRRTVDYINRLEDLIYLKCNHQSVVAWQSMVNKHNAFQESRHSIRLLFSRHIDILALRIVEHTSLKGEDYIAENRNEYLQFLSNSFLGGSIIALFALLKIFVDSYEFMPLRNAVLFSLNYSICFVIVKMLGGIIATKQPAMTASTIAKQIDKNNNLKIDSIFEIILVIKKVIRSQFISLVGNFSMAFLVAALLSAGMLYFDSFDSYQFVKPDYLVSQIQPSFSLVMYAATAGVFLASAGLISGYFNNKILDSNIYMRIKNSKFFLKSEFLATVFTDKLNKHTGNIALGILLGSAFLLSYLIPFSVDIRHIAFSSAYFGYAAMHGDFENHVLFNCFLGVCIIGLTNFLTSFSITLLLAIKSRGGTFALISTLIFHSFKDFLKSPISYFMFTHIDESKEAKAAEL